MTRAYEEIIEFIAAGTTSAGVAAFEPSPEARERVQELLARERDGELSVDEAAELDHFMQLEHLMRLAKARARMHLAHE